MRRAWPLLVLLACRGPVRDDAAAREWPLVTRPLRLDNPQAQAVSWPIWGSAFAVGPPISLRISLEASEGGGLLLGGAEGLRLLRAGPGWRIGTPVATAAELPGARLDVTLRVARDEVEVVAGPRTWRVALALGGEAGLDVLLPAGGELTVHALAVDRPLPRHPALGRPLRSVSGERRIGSVTDVWPPRHDLAWESLLAEQFDLIAVTDLYWSTVRGEDADFFFLPADLLVSFAEAHAQDVLGMFLVWDFELPAWLAGVDDVGAVLDEHIDRLVGRYAGRVDAWVVVNEAVLGPDESGTGEAGLAPSVWADALGPAYLERAFRRARAADPAALLLYNETGVEGPGAKTDHVLALLADLRARGVPVDGVGLQYHLAAATAPGRADLEATMRRFAALGLVVYVTELDVQSGDPARQARVYADVVDACLAVPACRVISLFGVSDRQAWDELGDTSPLLLDRDYAAKPAFFSVQARLAGGARPSTSPPSPGPGR